MQLKRTVVRFLLHVVFAVSLLWVTELLCVVGASLTHSSPESVVGFIVNAQIRGKYWPGQQPHSILFYLVRYFVVTAILVCVGVLSALYLKRTRKAGDHGNRA